MSGPRLLAAALLALPWLCGMAHGLLLPPKRIAPPRTRPQVPHNAGAEAPAARSGNHTPNAACMTHLRLHPDTVVCPVGCPFLRVEPTRFCDFKCVPPELCSDDDPLASYPDPETMRCGTCHVPACFRCGSSSHQCSICQDGYMLLGGKCHDKAWRYWILCYAAIAVAACFVLFYLISLAFRPKVNNEVVKQAVQFRHRSLFHDKDGNLYPLASTQVRGTYIAGVGVMLHFNWQFWLAMYSVAIACILAACAMHFGRRPGVMKIDATGNGYFEACNEKVRDQEAQVAEMEGVLFGACVFLYVASTVASIAFAVRQHRFAHRTSQETITMQDYVVVATGLPRMQGTHNVEEILTTFFQDALTDSGAEMVGVSPCWDYRSHREDIDEQNDWELERYEETFAKNFRIEGARWRPDGDDGTPSEPSPVRAPGPLQARLSLLDPLLGIGGAPDADRIRPEDRSPREVRAILESLCTSGSAYVVLRTERQRDLALAHLQANPPEMHGNVIEVHTEDAEPETVLWHNIGIRPSQFYTNMALGILALTIAIVILDVLFYFPSVAYLLSVMHVTGMSDGGMQGTLLGLLVCICNQIIYVLIGEIADRCGFISSDNHQRFYVLGYTVSVFFNTVIDLFVVLLLAQGYSMQQAIHAQHSSDSSMSTKAIAENPSVQMAVYVKYAEYIFPSCLLIPFLVEPFVARMLFLFKKWIIRSRTDVDLQEAEAQLQCPHFDLARYGDILINIMLCCGTLAFTYRDLYILWIFLVMSQVWIFWLDKYRLLRASSHSVFASSKLDETAHVMMSGPCGILAACIVFRLYGQKSGAAGLEIVQRFWKQTIEHGSVLARVVKRDTIVVIMLMVVGLHMYLHRLVLQALRAYTAGEVIDHDRDLDYSATSAKIASNWFNANPVFCLRSKYIFEGFEPCVKFKGGKEYLLEPNPKLGCYYENREAGTMNIGKDEWDRVAKSIKNFLPEALSPSRRPGTSGRHRTSGSSRNG